MPDCAEAQTAMSHPRSTDARAARLRKFKREQLIVDYLNRGVSVAEIAARFDLGEKRMRAVIREILARRMPGPPEEFVAIQVSRLNEALLVAYGAMGDMNLRAVDRVVRIVRELDRYHGFVAAKRLPRTPSLEEPADALAASDGRLDARPEIALQDLECLENAPGLFAAWETADPPEPPPQADLAFATLSAFEDKAPARVDRPGNPAQALEKRDSAPGFSPTPEASQRDQSARSPDGACGSPEPVEMASGPEAGRDARPEIPAQRLEIPQSAPENSGTAAAPSADGAPAPTDPADFRRGNMRMIPNGVMAAEACAAPA